MYNKIVTGEIGKVLINFVLAAVIIAVGIWLFVRPCNYITADRAGQRTCKCLGKVVNIKYLLGDEKAFDLPKTEHCVGVVRKRV
jgi:hypothetical protein